MATEWLVLLTCWASPATAGDAKEHQFRQRVLVSSLPKALPPLAPSDRFNLTGRPLCGAKPTSRDRTENDVLDRIASFQRGHFLWRTMRPALGSTALHADLAHYTISSVSGGCSCAPKSLSRKDWQNSIV